MNYTGILIGIVTFLIIGIFHPIVIKSEYYFSKKYGRFLPLSGWAFSFSPRWQILWLPEQFWQ